MADKKTILIVDDEPDIVSLTEKFLNLGDFETITSNNGKDALKIIEDLHNELTLILLDVMMPGISGWEVLRNIKNNEKSKNIPVILFTVKSFKEDIQKGKDLGAEGYITKPFSGKDLLAYVKKTLNKND